MIEYGLTVAISAGTNSVLLDRLLVSLKKQRTPIEILVERPSKLENLSQLRNRMYARAETPWVLFIDEDCELPDVNYVTRLIGALEKSGGAVGGYYLGGTGIWQRTYNALVNFWLKLHTNIPVAGNFAIKKIPLADFPFSIEHSFGGEEIQLARNLRNAGIEFILDPQLSVLHNSSRTCLGFFRRAWTHGLAPRAQVQSSTAFRDLIAAFRNIDSFRIKSLMIAYLATVVAARATWHLLPKK